MKHDHKVNRTCSIFVEVFYKDDSLSKVFHFFSSFEADQFVEDLLHDDNIRMVSVETFISALYQEVD